MYTAPLSHIRKELQTRSQKELTAICARLAVFSRDNKEWLTYLLFESNDELNFVHNVKVEVSTLFNDVNPVSVYLAKKTIRKILRLIQKQGRYSGQVQTQIELLLHFCAEMQSLDIAWKENAVLTNLYQSQIRKMERLITGLHEDLQFDFGQRLDALR